MNKNLKSISTKFKTTVDFVRRYAIFMVIIAVLLAYSFMVWRINVLINREPLQSDIDAKLQTVKRPAVDQNTVNKIHQLQDNSVQVQTLFKQARDNPFQE